MSKVNSEIIGFAAALSGAILERVCDRELLALLSAVLVVVSDNIALALTCDEISDGQSSATAQKQ